MDGTPTKLTEVVFDVAVTGEPLDVEFCGPMATGGVPRVAVSFQDPHSASADGTVRLYQPLSALNAELTLVKDIAGIRSVQNVVVWFNITRDILHQDSAVDHLIQTRRMVTVSFNALIKWLCGYLRRLIHESLRD